MRQLAIGVSSASRCSAKLHDIAPSGPETPQAQALRAANAPQKQPTLRLCVVQPSSPRLLATNVCSHKFHARDLTQRAFGEDHGNR